MGATDLIIKEGWSIAEVKAQGGWKTLQALQRYLNIQGEDPLQRNYDLGKEHSMLGIVCWLIGNIIWWVGLIYIIIWYFF